jgi:hypothetical protein
MIRIAAASWVFDPAQIGEVAPADPTPLLHDPSLLDSIAQLDSGLPEPADADDYTEPPELVSRLSLVEPRTRPFPAEPPFQIEGRGVTPFAAGILMLLVLTGATTAVLLLQSQVSEILAVYFK